MRYIPENIAITRVNRLKENFAERIRLEYEVRAKDCASCETPGACCLDAHFVNVHISKLEAAAIERVLRRFPGATQQQVIERLENAIEKYQLSENGDTYSQTYACPLFEKGVGCLVHREGKPLPCITHACYEKKDDVPHERLLAEQEAVVDRMNQRVYGRPARWLPIPLALREAIKNA
ncbi:MAG: hypothetical protein JNK51_11730 [Blastocatellia bacterium]|nr:hypothetical protein [Blastocatellia bacterium]